MMMDIKDRALLKAIALVGYCESADAKALSDDEVRQRWLERLKVYAEGVGHAIADTWASQPVSIAESGTPVTLQSSN